MVTGTGVGGELSQVETGESGGGSISEMLGAAGKAQLASASAVTEALGYRGSPPSPHERGIWEECHHKCFWSWPVRRWASHADSLPGEMEGAGVVVWGPSRSALPDS